ncbi:MAG TPA: rod shape-determining protein MreD [Candidatus Moranbacteria bacterium]|jgi:rod shape-determining protein MreD|nr:rod shape-determining protein MreD [Candidatus Moranbacteria bacterium]HOF42754.1 rod shape-determining protein MreD [Candidatus Moranbacteria bacterium]HPX94001.1 rod shape-determining protein MreD [Candidatus Moranbacteria bacterium]HQB59272.1 rod shape-determining protein MreD [Candidatus Moranbacteria bacterium]
MKKKLVYIFIGLIAILFQTSVIPVVTETKMPGDSVIMAALAWSILDGFFAFFPWAILLGLLYDIISYSPIGMHVLVILPVLYFVSFFSRRFTMESKGVRIVLFIVFVVSVTIFSRIILFLVNSWGNLSLNGFWKIFASPAGIVWQLAHNFVLFFFWFFVIKKCKEFFKIES